MADWKQHLLKSSLPLETIVAEILEGSDFHVYGEYPYLRSDGTTTKEFSVDLYARYERERSVNQYSLNALVECKYSSPGVDWVFRPYTGFDHGPTIQDLSELTPFLIEHRAPYDDLERDLTPCGRAVAIHPRGSDPNSIQHGLSQVRYGVVELAANKLRGQMDEWHDCDILVEFLLPVLVTTAPLWILRRGLSLDDHANAAALSDVADNVDALVAVADHSVTLSEFGSESLDRLMQERPVQERLAQRSRLVPNKMPGPVQLPVDWSLRYNFHYLSHQVLVVNVHSLKRVTRLAVNSVHAVWELAQRIGRLEKDFQEGTRTLVPIDSSELR